MSIVSEGADWIARVPAFGGLILSIWALWRGRTTLSVYLGLDYKVDTINVANNSPHDVSIVWLGVIEADGRLANYWEEGDYAPSLPHRLKARDVITFQVPHDMGIYCAFGRSVRGRAGCYIRLADGSTYSDISRARRAWWWVRNLFDRKTSDKNNA